MKYSCGKCKACESPDCGHCVNCQDKPKYGGQNTRKQRCMNRKCTTLPSTGGDDVSHSDSPKPKDSGLFKKPQSAPSSPATRTTAKSAGTNTKVTTGTNTKVTTGTNTKVKTGTNTRVTTGTNTKVTTVTNMKVTAGTNTAGTNTKATAKSTGKDVEKSTEIAKTNASPRGERTRSLRTSTGAARGGNLPARDAPERVDKGPYATAGKQNRDRQTMQTPKSTTANIKDEKKTSPPVGSSNNSSSKKSTEKKDNTDKFKTAVEDKASPATAVRSGRKSGGTAVSASPGKVDLPSVELSSMTMVELKVLIQELLERVCGEDRMWQRSSRPSWWPYSLVWPTSAVMWEQEKYWQPSLLQMVRNCYKQLGQEEKLTRAAISPAPLEASPLRTAPPRMARSNFAPAGTASTSTSPSKTGLAHSATVAARPVSAGSSKKGSPRVAFSDKSVVHTRAIVHEVPARLKTYLPPPVKLTPTRKTTPTKLVSALKTTPTKAMLSALKMMPTKAGTPGSLRLGTPEKKSPVNEREVGPISPIKTTTFPRDLLFPFCAEIYICYFCEKEFLNKNKMRDHQKECSERPPELHQFKPITVTTTENDDAHHREPPPMSPKRNNLHLYSPLSLKHFCNYMDLLPKQTAAKLRANRASRPSMEIDCNLEEMELKTPATPITPRTPTSLISQLSRDDSGAHAKKRLSYSLSVDKDVKIEALSESDSSDSEDNQSEVASRENKEPNLLNIPISSLLGQRLKNYVHVDSPMSVVDNMEGFCRTPVKNSFLEKLRKKDSAYPILYKPRRLANLHKENHTYKFNRKENKEFLCRLNTGLNPASLKKVRLTKPVRVDVERMSRRQLLRWVPPYMLDRQLRRLYKPSRTARGKVKVGSHCEFPSGPTLLAQNIDKLLGLKRKSSSTPKSPVNTPLSLGNCISEEMEAEVSKQKLTLYRCLLYEMSVLKPVVAVQDFRTDKKQSGSILKKNSPVLSQKLSEPGIRNNVSKTPTKVNFGAAVSNRMVSESSTPEKKTNYKTLKSLLLQTATKDHSDIPQSSTCDSAQIKAPGVFEQKVLKSPPVTEAPAANISPVANMRASSSRAQTPGDDSLSIISLSSDGDATNPNCCAACRNKCLQSPCLCSPVLVKSPAQPDQAQMQKATDLAPIDVILNQFAPEGTAGFKPGGIPSQEEIMYNIPSPVSTRSESPLPPTPPSEKLCHKDTLGISQDQIHTFSPFIGETKIPDTPMSVESAHKGDLMEDAFMSNRLRTLRSTARSKSLTPSASPVKQDFVASGSLPNSPEKAVTESSRSAAANRSSFLQKMASFPVEMKPSFAKRKIFTGTLDKIRTRSVGDKTVSGNSDDATESLKKCSSKLEELDKKVMFRESVGEAGDNMPVRRSKRKASLHLSDDYEYGAPSPKIRKYNSESVASR